MMLLGHRNADLGIAISALGLGDRWMAIRHRRDDGYIMERVGDHAEPAPTESELLAALAAVDQARLARISSAECLRRICALHDPTTGQPIYQASLAEMLGDATLPTKMRVEASIAWNNIGIARQLGAMNTAQNAEADRIVAEVARLRAIHASNKEAIAEGTIMTQAELTADQRWAP